MKHRTKTVKKSGRVCRRCGHDKFKMSRMSGCHYCKKCNTRYERDFLDCQR